MKRSKCQIFISWCLCLALLGCTFAGITTGAEQTDASPAITYQGLVMQDFDDSKLPLFISNPNGSDIDFYPDNTVMGNGGSYFEYTYQQDTEVTGFAVTGWWPKSQGPSKIKYAYHNGTAWVESDAVSLNWTVSNGGPEELKILLDTPVVTKAVRIYILDYNKGFGAQNGGAHNGQYKCNVRLMCPVTGNMAKRDLLALIDSAKDILDNADVGTNPGQFPADAYTAFSDAISEAVAVSQVQDVTETACKDAAEKLRKSISAFQGSKIIPGKLPTPDISMEGLTGGKAQLLVDNPNNSADFDFDGVSRSISSKIMTINNGYFIYDYMSVVEIHSIDLVGWWPKDQAVKNLSFSYWKNGEWVDCDQNVEVNWVTPANTGVLEEYTLTLSEAVKTTKFRIKVNTAYASWGKVNMRRMEPKGTLLQDLRALYLEIRSAQDYVNSVLVGDKPGEFPQAAVDKLQLAVSEITSESEDPNIGENGLLSLLDKLKEAIAEFVQAQNPFESKWNISLDGLTKTFGVEQYLLDGQNATYLTVSEYGTIHDGYLEFEYKDSGEFLLRGVTLLAPDALNTAPNNIDIEYYDGNSWVSAATSVELDWRQNILHTQGYTILLDQAVSVTRFRIKINESYGLKSETSLSQAAIIGNPKVAAETLDEAIQRAEGTLNICPFDDYSSLLRIQLMYAKNDDPLALSTAGKVNALIDRINYLCDAVDADMQNISLQDAKASLKKLIDQADSLDRNQYSESSFQVLIAVRNSAYKVWEHADSKLEAVVGAIRELEQALGNLTEAPNKPKPIDTSKLQDLYDQYKAMKQGDYTEESWNVLQNALKRANGVLQNPSSAEEVTEAINALKNAIDGLKRVEEEKQEERPSKNPGENVPPTNSVNTGDSGHVLWIVAVLLVCSTAILLHLRRKRNRIS